MGGVILFWVFYSVPFLIPNSLWIIGMFEIEILKIGIPLEMNIFAKPE